MKINVKDSLEKEHIIDNHIFVTDEQLKQRLFDEPITVSSRFENKDYALRSVEATLANNQACILDWLNNCYSKRLIVCCQFRFVIGSGFVKGTDYRNRYKMNVCTVVLEADEHFRSFQIVTAYPEIGPGMRGKVENDKKRWREQSRRWKKEAAK